MHEKNIIILFVLMLVLVNSSAGQASPSDDDIRLDWRYSAVEDITAITAGKIDKNPVVVVAAGNLVHVLDKGGNAVQNYTIQSQGNIYAIHVGDVDDDERDEILLGVGWIETEEINLNKKYPPPDGIPEEVDVLYKILKSKGALYVVDDGGISQWSDVDQWVRSIALTDVNGDDEDETVIVSGGHTNNYYKRYTDVVYRHRYCWIAWDLDFEPYSKDECICPICVWDNKTDKCYENETWEECGWNETIDKGWNLSETSSANGSVVVYDKSGSLLSKSHMGGISKTFLNAEVSNLYQDNDAEIILGSGDKIYILDWTGGVMYDYSALGEVKNVYSSDVNGDENDDIIFSFVNSSNGVYGFDSITREGGDLWVYYLDSDSVITATYMKKIDTHGINEILFISDGILYVVDGRGQLDWSYQFKYSGILIKKIQRLFSLDLDDDGFENILLASNKVVYDYEIVGTFIKKQSADKYLGLGREAYEANRYLEAKSHLDRARQLYAEADYPAGVSECDSLLDRVAGKLTGNRRLEADSQYAKALTYYSTRDYESAKKHILAARSIYEEIGDMEGISRCDTLTETIDEILAKRETTTTTTFVVVSTTLSQGSDSSFQLPSEPLPVIVLAVLLIAAIFAMKKKRGPELERIDIIKKPKEKHTKTVEVKLGEEHEKKEEEKKSGLVEEWQSLEEQWKKLDEI